MLKLLRKNFWILYIRTRILWILYIYSFIIIALKIIIFYILIEVKILQPNEIINGNMIFKFIAPKFENLENQELKSKILIIQK